MEVLETGDDTQRSLRSTRLANVTSFFALTMTTNDTLPFSHGLGISTRDDTEIMLGIFFFQRFTCNTVGGPWWVWSLFRSVAGQLFLQYFDAVGWVF